MAENPYDKFDHPCKGSCSGWKQGYEKGQLELKNNFIKILEEISYNLSDVEHSVKRYSEVKLTRIEFVKIMPAIEQIRSIIDKGLE